MDETVDARDIMRVNAITQRRFHGRVLGRVRPTGPRPRDPYRLVPEEGGEEIDVLPGIRITVEPEGAVFLMRARGQVLRVEWLPTLVEQIGVVSDARSEFLRTCVTEKRRSLGFRAAIRRKPDRRL